MAQQLRTAFRNPLPVQVADPWILSHEDAYYLYGTHDRDPHAGIPVYTSTDLVHWRWEGFAFKRHRKNFAQHHHWSPEVQRVGDAFYMFFCASPNPTPEPPLQMRIVLARSDSPLGPFVELEAPLFEPEPGDEAIEPHLFMDDDGAPHFFWTRVTTGQNQICHAPMREDLTGLAGSPEVILTAEQAWESHAWDGHQVVEGPFVHKEGAHYYLFYTANHFRDPNYAMGYARARAITGPWVKPREAPILQRSETVAGPGNGVIVSSPDGTESFLAYHTHQSPREAGWRMLALDRLHFEAGEDDVLTPVLVGPTNTPQPLPQGASALPTAQSFPDFGEGLDRSQWLVVNEAPAAWELKAGRLHIHTQDGDMWKQHADFQNLFLQYAPAGDFAIKAQVAFHPAQNFEQAFLIVYQDPDHYVRLSHAYDDDLEFLAAYEVAGDFQYDRLPNTLDSDVWLAIRKEGDCYTQSVSTDGENWIKVGHCEVALEAPMVGLGAISPGSGSERIAVFENFLFEVPEAEEAIMTAVDDATNAE